MRAARLISSIVASACQSGYYRRLYRKKIGSLGDKADFIPKLMQIHSCNILPVDGDLSGCNVVKAGNQPDQRAFSGTGASNKGSRLPGAGFQRKISLSTASSPSG